MRRHRFRRSFFYARVVDKARAGVYASGMWQLQEEQRVRVRETRGYGHTIVVLSTHRAGRPGDAVLVCSHDTLHDVWTTHDCLRPRAAIARARSVWRVLTGWCASHPDAASDASPICEPGADLLNVDSIDRYRAAWQRFTGGVWLAQPPARLSDVPEYRPAQPRGHMEPDSLADRAISERRLQHAQATGSVLWR
jgi:hypothetical protein